MCVRDCTEYSHDVDVQTCFLYLDVILNAQCFLDVCVYPYIGLLLFLKFVS